VVVHCAEWVGRGPSASGSVTRECMITCHACVCGVVNQVVIAARGRCCRAFHRCCVPCCAGAPLCAGPGCRGMAGSWFRVCSPNQQWLGCAILFNPKNQSLGSSCGPAGPGVVYVWVLLLGFVWPWVEETQSMLCVTERVTWDRMRRCGRACGTCVMCATASKVWGSGFRVALRDIYPSQGLARDAPRANKFPIRWSLAYPHMWPHSMVPPC
jgi:hypothetical protein